jgi:DNA-binding PadR family transcriptional regulator
MRPGDSTLPFLLLGLLDGEARSGYDLRRVFQDTPMAAHSDSPGSIYPALKSLERRGFVKARTDTARPLRPRRVYRVTPSGRAALLAWLRRPPAPRDILRNSIAFEAKLAFMTGRLAPSDIARITDAYAQAVAGHIENVRAYAREHAAHLPLSARLALEGGLALLEARHSWVRRASRELRRHADEEQ